MKNLFNNKVEMEIRSNCSENGIPEHIRVLWKLIDMNTAKGCVPCITYFPEQRYVTYAVTVTKRKIDHVKAVVEVHNMLGLEQSEITIK